MVVARWEKRLAEGKRLSRIASLGASSYIAQPLVRLPRPSTN